MRLTELAYARLMTTTPRFPYNPNDTELNDGIYVYRMAPFTTDNHKGGVWFPDVSIEQSYWNCRSNLKIMPAVQIVESMLKESGIDIDPMIDALFSLFHEEGHWRFYVDEYILKGKSGIEYLRDTENISIEMGIPKFLQRARDDHSKYGEYHKRYREHPFEKCADDYAIRKLKEIKSS